MILFYPLIVLLFISSFSFGAKINEIDTPMQLVTALDLVKTVRYYLAQCSQSFTYKHALPSECLPTQQMIETKYMKEKVTRKQLVMQQLMNKGR